MLWLIGPSSKGPTTERGPKIALGNNTHMYTQVQIVFLRKLKPPSFERLLSKILDAIVNLSTFVLRRTVFLSVDNPKSQKHQER